MSIKPLYLAHGRHVRVRNQDDVLVVRSMGRAASIYPFKRLSRVVSANDVHWHNGALLACLQAGVPVSFIDASRSEEHTSELQSRGQLVCRLLLEKKNTTTTIRT